MEDPLERAQLLAQKIDSMLKDHHEVIFVFAPTSYGKTMASPYLLDLARKNMMANRLIHVVPVRALLREIYDEKFKRFSNQFKFKVGYQSMDRIPGGDKSPYFLSDIIVTTLDSFLWNVYKIPVAEISKILREISMGHYYPVLAAIQTSITVFDEAHVYIGEYGEDGGRVAIISALNALRELEVPIVLSTATMSSKFVNAIIETLNLDKSRVGVIYACDSMRCNDHVKSLENLGTRVEYVKGLPRAVDWKTTVINVSDVNISSLIERYCRDKIVLVVSNTVDRAVELYRKNRDRCKNAALIHSRLVERDKMESYNKINKIKEKGRGLIVASPIIEVGVEVDADVLITDEAPLENLIQRAGRLCRSKRSCNEAEIIILKNVAENYPYDENEVKKSVNAIEKLIKNGSCIEWRLFESKNCKPAVDILEDIAEKPNIVLSELLRDYLVYDSRPISLIEELSFKNLYRLFRSLSMIKVAVDISQCVSNGNIVSDLNCVESGFFATSIPTLRWLEEKKGKCIETCGNAEKSGVKILVLTAKYSTLKKVEFNIKETISSALYNAIYFKEDDAVFRKVHMEIKSVLDEGEVGADFFVKIKPDCYKKGEGAYV
ncbi:MAG: CRISPR-associated helicase Cas3' [Desulfurococcaceae archaeon]